MNVCKDCIHWSAQKDGRSGVCFRQPPTVMIMGASQDAVGRQTFNVQGFRSPVGADERACGEYRSLLDEAPLMPWNRAAQ